MKIEITGSVRDTQGYLTGIVDLPEDQANRLIALNVAKAVASEQPECSTDSANDSAPEMHSIVPRSESTDLEAGKKRSKKS